MSPVPGTIFFSGGAGIKRQCSSANMDGVIGISLLGGKRYMVFRFCRTTVLLLLLTWVIERDKKKKQSGEGEKANLHVASKDQSFASLMRPSSSTSTSTSPHRPPRSRSSEAQCFNNSDWLIGHTEWVYFWRGKILLWKMKLWLRVWDDQRGPFRLVNDEGCFQWAVTNSFITHVGRTHLDGCIRQIH